MRAETDRRLPARRGSQDPHAGGNLDTPGTECRHENTTKLGLSIALTALVGCRGESSESAPSTTAPESMQGAGDVAEAEGGWSAGDTIPSGKDGVADVQILEVHENGQGEACGSGKTATLAYKAMLADGTVIDPGTRPFTFKVGSGQAIVGWDVVVARMATASRSCFPKSSRTVRARAT